MKGSTVYRKVTMDLFFEQMKWSAWFLGIITVVHLIIRYFLPDTRESIGGFFEFSRSSAGIFMLVLGILSAYGFMQYYVQQGISRKDMFKGIALAAGGLSVFVTVAVLVVNGIEHLISQQFPGSSVLVNSGIDDSWLVEAAFYALSIYVYFLIGWLISIGYYRFGWIIGLGFVVLAIIAISLHDYFLSGGLTEAIPWLPDVTREAAPFVGTIGTAGLIAVLLAAIYGLTKRVMIRM